MESDDIFGEIEDFLNFDETPSTPITTQDASSPATAANPSTPGQQTSNINQYSPGGPGVGGIRGGGGTGSTPMLNNGYTSNGCSMTTKAVLGERLRNQLGAGRGDHPPSGELKRKLDEGIPGSNDPIFNKTPKMEIKDEPQSQHGNVMMKTEIKEEKSSSQLEAILGLNSPVSANMKHEINPNIGGGGELKSEYTPLPNKAVQPTQGGLLQQALMDKRPLNRDTGSSNVLPMFNGCNSVAGGNVRAPGMTTNGLGGGRNSLEVGSMALHNDPQAVNAIRRLKELAKDPTLNHEAKQAEAVSYTHLTLPTKA